MSSYTVIHSRDDSVTIALLNKLQTTEVRFLAEAVIFLFAITSREALALGNKYQGLSFGV
jgi:hypothetical protein